MESSGTGEIVVSREDGVVTLTLDRPERRNALSRALVAHLSELVDELDGDASVRVVIVTGAGDKAFCAGADLKERQGMSEGDVRAFVPTLSATFTALASMTKPTIAAINGVALGGGLELALACDLRVAADHATMGLPETQLAIIPGAGGTQRLPRLVGVARAKELIFTGRRVSADQALEMTLVNRVCPSRDILTVAGDMARSMLAAGPIALAQAKFALDNGAGLPMESGLALEWQAYERTISTEDRLEALAAFRDKRPAKFTGR
jgi:enoyl-CoA hydratase/carnithine racemase